MLTWLPQLLQTNDASFPSGSFAHSFGLEGLVQLGQVTDQASFRDFLCEQMVPAMEHHELPFVRLAYEATQDAAQDKLRPPALRAAARPEPNCVVDGDEAFFRFHMPRPREPRAVLCKLLALDQRYGAMKGSFELRQASSRIGSQRLQMLQRLKPHSLLANLEQEQAAGRFQAHAAIIAGVQNALNDTPLDAALLGYYYQTLAAAVCAALKLIRMGQLAAQKMLAERLAEAAAVIARSLVIDEMEIGWFQPTLDIASMRHETAYSRIFIS